MSHNNILLPKIFLGIFAAITLICCSSCKEEDLSHIVGSWYGTRTYYNPVGGQKYQYLTIRFESSGIGSLEYEAPTSFSAASFMYSVKNNIISCNGAYVNSSGDIESDFELDLRIEGDRLIPINHYDMFILTKDNSVTTDSDGKEFVDNTELIHGVWKHNSGTVILVLSDSKYTEYTLMSNSSNIYSKKSEGSFSYNALRKYALINGNRFDVNNLTETKLQLKSEDGTIFNYDRGTNADIPTNGQNSTDYKSILENSYLGWIRETGTTALIRFYDNNQIYYVEKSSKTLGSWGHISLTARGTYSLNGKTINCIFDDVSWQSGDSYAKDYFPGWTSEKTNYKDFIIEEINVERLKLKIDGKSYYFYNADFPH